MASGAAGGAGRAQIWPQPAGPSLEGEAHIKPAQNWHLLSIYQSTDPWIDMNRPHRMSIWSVLFYPLTPGWLIVVFGI